MVEAAVLVQRDLQDRQAQTDSLDQRDLLVQVRQDLKDLQELKDLLDPQDPPDLPQKVVPLLATRGRGLF